MKHFIFIVTLFIGATLFGQSYLNKIYTNFGGMPENALLALDSSYIVAGNDITNYRTNDFGHFDLLGNLISKKSYYDPHGGNRIVACWKCLKKNEGNIYFAQTIFVGTDSMYVRFWKLNDQLDSIFTKSHIIFKSGVPHIEDMAFDTDSTFIVSGYLGRKAEGKWDLWVAKFDTTFNVIWENRIVENTPNLTYGYRGEDLTIDAYGSVLVSGRFFLGNGGTQVHIFKTVYARFDRENGDLLWEREFNEAPGSSSMATLDEGDGTYRFAQIQHLSFYPRTTYADSNQIRFGLLDTLGNVIWETLLGPKYGQFWFRDLQRTPDGNYYLSGRRNLPFKDLSSGFKISPQGDSLWLRNYLHQDTTADNSHILHFQSTSDSGYIHVGYYIDWDKDLDTIRSNYSWLLKTDKYGCQVKDCHTISLPEVRPTQYDVSLYPNPNSGTFLIEIPEESFKKDFRIMVYNTAGVQVYASPLKRAREKIALTNVPPGLYMLNLLEGGKVVYGQKFVLQ